MSELLNVRRRKKESRSGRSEIRFEQEGSVVNFALQNLYQISIITKVEKLI